MASSWLRLQAIAQPAHRLDAKRMLRLREPLAQPVDMDIQGALVALKIVAPDVFDEAVAREGLPRIAGELEQQLELLERQRQARALHRDFVGLAVHHQVADL